VPKKEANPFGKTRLPQRLKNAILKDAKHGKEKTKVFPRAYYRGLVAAKFEN